jgi:hypothetical protein
MKEENVQSQAAVSLKNNNGDCVTQYEMTDKSAYNSELYFNNPAHTWHYRKTYATTSALILCNTYHINNMIDDLM